MTKKIDYRFKILYAIAMIMLVAGHCGGGGINGGIFEWFPMAGQNLILFIFASGYFYNSQAEENVLGYVWKKVKQLIIPLYLYTIGYGLFVMLLRSKGFMLGGDFTFENIVIAPITNGHQFLFNMAGWFVAPLFMAQFYNIIFRKILSIFGIKNEYIFLFINVILGIFGNTLACDGKNTGWWLVLVRFTYFVTFYEIGIFYRTVLEKYDLKIHDFWYLAILMILKSLMMLVFQTNLSFTPSWCNDFTGPLMPIVSGVIEIAFWFRISKVLEPAIGKSKYIGLIANNTYSIMMNQFLGFWIVNYIYMVLGKYSSIFSGFDIGLYKSDIWYLFIPLDLRQMRMVYLVAGILIPIANQLVFNKAKAVTKSIDIKR